MLSIRGLSAAGLRKVAVAGALMLGLAGAGGAQSWTPLKNPPSVGVTNPLLLTDGTVIVQSISTPDWWRLTPNEHGSYAKGTWSQIASMPDEYAPLFYASAVLPDGRVIVEGGEYLCYGGCSGQVWSTRGAIYDPVANKWKAVTPPAGWTGIGDAQSVVLANGTFMLANCCNTEDALLNAKTQAWTITGNGKADGNNEEGWTLLPNDLVLTVDVNNPSDPTNSEVYAPRTGTWSSAGSTVTQLDASSEIGPAVLRPDGSVFATGATGHTAIYDTWKRRWTPGPDFPAGASGVGLVAADAPAALLPDGNVLATADPNGAPTYFFEFNGTKLEAVPGTAASASEGTGYINMLVLPTGHILTTDGSSELEVYTAAGTYNPAWRPKIVSAPREVRPGGSYTISGYRFNGMSQGAAYGDDEQSATNYPLVRIANKRTGHVFYSRTHDHSSMAVAFPGCVSTHFDVPHRQEYGESELVVVANGIPSEPVTVDVR